MYYCTRCWRHLTYEDLSWYPYCLCDKCKNEGYTWIDTNKEEMEPYEHEREA